MTSQNIRVRYHNGVAQLNLHRPDQANALDLELARAALLALREAEHTPDVFVLSITGTGDYFCGGGDVKGMAAAHDKPAFLHELAEAAHELVLAMVSSRLFIVSAVNGPAAGAGLGLVLNSDYVVASDRAKLMAAYAAIGLTPDSGVSYLLPRAVGYQRAMELMLIGSTLDAQTAREWGLVNEVVTSEALEPRTIELCERLASRAPQALAATKKLARHEMIAEYRNHLALESLRITKMVARSDSQALIARFVAKG